MAHCAFIVGLEILATAITMLDRVILIPMILVRVVAGVAIESSARHGVRGGRGRSAAPLDFALGVRGRRGCRLRWK